MSQVDSPSRRRLLKQAFGVPLLPAVVFRLSSAPAADIPLLSPDAPEAKAVKHVEDAAKAEGATRGSTCANCGLYQGSSGSIQGACQIFPGKLVKAAGWCSSWAPQM